MRVEVGGDRLYREEGAEKHKRFHSHSSLFRSWDGFPALTQQRRGGEALVEGRREGALNPFALFMQLGTWISARGVLFPNSFALRGHRGTKVWDNMGFWLCTLLIFRSYFGLQRRSTFVVVLGI